MLFQSRQDRMGIAIFVTTVKSQINHFLISVSGIVGMIFFNSSNEAFPTGAFPSS